MPDDAAATEGTEQQQEGGEQQEQQQEEEIIDPKVVAQQNYQMRRENQGLRKTNKDLQAQLDAFKAQTMSETEKAVAQARLDAEAKYRGDLLRERVMARAAGKLTDAEDAPRFLDLDNLDLDNVQIDQAIKTLLDERPYLAVAQQPRVPTKIDQGSQGGDLRTQTASDWLRDSLRRG